jgi:serine/threonine protein phosphatase PrpC
MELGRGSRHASCSTRGRRTVNEDRAATLVLGSGTYVVAVADGMGGVVAGDVASEAAMTAFLGAMRTSGAKDAYASLCAAFEAADAAVRGAVTSGREGMGTTLVAAVAHGTDIWIGNVGDSRAVLVLPDETVCLSTEHSLVSEALRSGRMTELEALRSQERHVLSRALGDGDARPDLGYHSLREHPGATRAMLLVGSDGLFNFVGETELLEISAEERRASGVVEQLVRRAIENGSDDNVSAAALVLDARPSRWRGPMWAAAVLALLALATTAYSTRGEIVSRIAAVRGAAPPPATARVRLPVIRGQHPWVGISGALCMPKQARLSTWKVAGATPTSVVIEIRTDARLQKGGRAAARTNRARS